MIKEDTVIIYITGIITELIYTQNRQVTRTKSRSGAVVKYQRMFVVLKATSNVKQHFKSGATPLYCSLVTSLQELFLGKKDSFPDAAINQD